MTVSHQSSNPILEISINGAQDQKTFTSSPASLVLSSVNPSLYSPVLKTDLTIVFTSTLGSVVDKNDVECWLSDKSGNKVNMNVLSVDESTTKTIVVKYPGTYSGSYKLSCTHTAGGGLFAQTLDFDANAYVDSISSNDGPITGGKILTITGRGFSNVTTD